MSSSTHIPGTVVLLAGPDEEALASLQPAAEMLTSFGVAAETAVLSLDPLEASRWAGRCAVIVASPDAALPAAVAAGTVAPVIRVPTESADRRGLDLLTDGDQLPAGPATGIFATMAIGAAGAKNAALFVVAALAVQDERLRAAYADFRARQTEAVLAHPPLEP